MQLCKVKHGLQQDTGTKVLKPDSTKAKVYLTLAIVPHKNSHAMCNGGAFCPVTYKYEQIPAGTGITSTTQASP
eukprot:1160691-Pelagomonas_calceolata.AAC.9